MRAHCSIGSWHGCDNIVAEAVAIHDDGTECSADHLEISVRGHDGEIHKALCVYLPIDLARSFAKAINEVSTAQTGMSVPEQDRLL
jgi:hypothetical protein